MDAGNSGEFGAAVRAYRYVAPSASLLERLFLNRFWDWLVGRLPMWVAPNALTLAGGACCLAVYLADWFVSPECRGTARPRWIYVVFAFLFFAYQTLDGTDGKQARRTKSGSALGEMMDHGVDAVVTALVAFVSADAFGFGIDSIVPWVSAFGSQLAFFTSNLTLVHRGSQKFLDIDIMELQWGLILGWLVSGIFGPDVWRAILIPLPLPDVLGPAASYLGDVVFGVPAGPRPGVVEGRFVMALMGVGGTVSNFFLYSIHALQPYFGRHFGKEPPAHVVARAPGTGLAEWARQVAIVSTHGALAFAARNGFAAIADPALRHQALRALLLGSCFAFGDLVNRLLLMRVARVALPLLPPSLGLMAAFAVAARWTTPAVHQGGAGPPLWWALVAVCFLSHLVFAVRVARKLALALGIRIFRVRGMTETATASR